MARSKADLIKKAKALGIDTKGMGVRELARSITEAKEDSSDESGSVGGARPAKNATAVSVVDASGHVIRTYSEKKHGENFRALADSFVSKPSNNAVKVVAVE